MSNKQLVPVWVVIPAAGIGQRMQSVLPKQYIKIHDKTLIEHTLDCFLEHKQIAGIVVVISDTDNYWQSLKVNTGNAPVITVKGGKDRCDSVIAGLNYLERIKKIPLSSWVMVHDAARPCLSTKDLDAVLALRETNGVGGLLASPVRDTMKRSIALEKTSIAKESSLLSTVSHTESRENLWHALTPQMFCLGALQNALSFCQNNDIGVTDESSAMESVGEKPLIVKCSHNNIKVTHPDDIKLATYFLSGKKGNNKELM